MQSVQINRHAVLVCVCLCECVCVYISEAKGSLKHGRSLTFLFGLALCHLTSLGLWFAVRLKEKNVFTK